MKAVNILGEGAEEYFTEIVDAYLKKLYNEDDRGALQTFIETQPNAWASFLLGSLTSGVMNVGEIPGIVGNINTENALKNGESITTNQAQRYGAMMADLYEPGSPQ